MLKNLFFNDATWLNDRIDMDSIKWKRYLVNADYNLEKKDCSLIGLKCLSTCYEEKIIEDPKDCTEDFKKNRGSWRSEECFLFWGSRIQSRGFKNAIDKVKVHFKNQNTRNENLET